MCSQPYSWPFLPAHPRPSMVFHNLARRDIAACTRYWWVEVRVRMLTVTSFWDAFPRTRGTPFTFDLFSIWAWVCDCFCTSAPGSDVFAICEALGVDGGVGVSDGDQVLRFHLKLGRSRARGAAGVFFCYVARCDTVTRVLTAKTRKTTSCSFPTTFIERLRHTSQQQLYLLSSLPVLNGNNLFWRLYRVSDIG